MVPLLTFATKNSDVRKSYTNAKKIDTFNMVQEFGKALPITETSYVINAT